MLTDRFVVVLLGEPTRDGRVIPWDAELEVHSDDAWPVTYRPLHAPREGVEAVASVTMIEIVDGRIQVSLDRPLDDEVWWLGADLWPVEWHHVHHPVACIAPEGPVRFRGFHMQPRRFCPWGPNDQLPRWRDGSWLLAGWSR